MTSAAIVQKLNFMGQVYIVMLSERRPIDAFIAFIEQHKITALVIAGQA